MEIPGEPSRELYTLFLRRFGNLVAGGVHDNGGVVEVLFHHIFYILLPPFEHIARVIVLGLVYVPDVHVLVHHQHTLPVAGVKKGL